MGRGQAEGRRPSAVRAERAHAFPHRPARPLRVTAAPLLRVGTGGSSKPPIARVLRCPCWLCFRKNMQRNKQVAMGRKKFNMDPKKVSEEDAREAPGSRLGLTCPPRSQRGAVTPPPCASTGSSLPDAPAGPRALPPHSSCAPDVWGRHGHARCPLGHPVLDRERPAEEHL